jgi:hypothetical protein
MNLASVWACLPCYSRFIGELGAEALAFLPSRTRVIQLAIDCKAGVTGFRIRHLVFAGV